MADQKLYSRVNTIVHQYNIYDYYYSLLTVTVVAGVDLSVKFLHRRELGKHFCHHHRTNLLLL